MYEDKKKRDEGERAIATLDRYMRILGMFVGDIKLTTQEICNQLGANIRKTQSLPAGSR